LARAFLVSFAPSDQVEINVMQDKTSELLAKLDQIREQAGLTLEELPLRLARDRLQLIIGLAGYLKTEIELIRRRRALEQPVPAEADPDAARRH
jgi:hypothetical protein